MTIGKRIIVLLAAALLALLIVGVVGITQFRVINEEVGKLADDNFPGLMAVGDIADSYKELRALLLEHLLEKDAGKRKALEGQIKSVSELFDKQVESYKNFVSDKTEDGIFQEMLARYTDYRKIYNQLLEQSIKGEVEQAQSAVSTSLSPAGTALDAAIKKVASHNLKDEESARQVVDTSYHSAVTWFGAVSAVFIILLLTMGWMLYRAIKHPLAVMEKMVETVERNLDFTLRVPIRSHDEVGLTVAAFNNLLATLQNSLGEISQRIHKVAYAATEMNRTAAQMSDSSALASDSASNMAATVQQVTVSINHVADRASEADTISRRSGEIAADGQQVIHAAVDEINGIAGDVHGAASQIIDLQKESGRITSVIQVIKEVADQTNLLALNAAIEAARAGEAGRGFAVVADEVRKLAERTTSSTREIAQIIASIQSGSDAAVLRMQQMVSRVEGGVHKAERAGQSIEEIQAGSAQVVDTVGDISHAIREQSAASLNIARQVERIAQMSEDNSQTAEQTSTAAKELELLSRQMQDIVARYRIA